jgi:hypothetical protein
MEPEIIYGDFLRGPSTNLRSATRSPDLTNEKHVSQQEEAISRLGGERDLKNCSDLCKGCREIAFDKVLRPSRAPPRGSVEYELCSLAHVRPGSACSMCQFLWSVRADPHESLEMGTLGACAPEKYQRAFRLGESEPLEDDKHPILFFVNSHRKQFEWQAKSFGVEHESSTGERARICETPEQIRWDCVQQWIKYCQEHHIDSCGQAPLVPSLSVIDCQTRRIIRLPSDYTPYLTLSYVVSLAFAPPSGHG